MLPVLDRRRFLALIAAGLPAAYIESKIGLWEKVKTIFIPKAPDLIDPAYVPPSFARWVKLRPMELRLITEGVTRFPTYLPSGVIAEPFLYIERLQGDLALVSLRESIRRPDIFAPIPYPDGY